jgi:formylmethanofuran dehydrogenase subunit A
MVTSVLFGVDDGLHEAGLTVNVGVLHNAQESKKLVLTFRDAAHLVHLCG